MRKYLFFLALVPLAASANAPFCMVSGAGGAQCHYWDLGSCQQAARSVQGMCAANPQAMQPPPTYQPQQIQPMRAPYDVNAAAQRPNFAQSFADGYERGQRQRQSREEHAARMRLIEAQTQALRAETEMRRAQAQAATPSYASGPETLAPAPAPGVTEYKCRSVQGAITYRPEPIGGSVCWPATELAPTGEKRIPAKR